MGISDTVSSVAVFLAFHPVRFLFHLCSILEVQFKRELFR